MMVPSVIEPAKISTPASTSSWSLMIRNSRMDREIKMIKPEKESTIINSVPVVFHAWNSKETVLSVGLARRRSSSSESPIGIK